MTVVTEERTCIKCHETWPLSEYPRYAPGKHRNECRVCAITRKRSYHTPEYLERMEARHQFRPKPLNLEALYGRGTRCWCCRRNSSGQMLCATCRGER